MPTDVPAVDGGRFARRRLMRRRAVLAAAAAAVVVVAGSLLQVRTTTAVPLQPWLTLPDPATANVGGAGAILAAAGGVGDGVIRLHSDAPADTVIAFTDFR